MGSAASKVGKGAADNLPPPKPVDNVPPPKPAKDGSGGNGAADNVKPQPGAGIPSVTLAPSAIQTALASLDDVLIDKGKDFAIEFAQDRLFDALLGKSDNSTTVTPKKKPNTTRTIDMSAFAPCSAYAVRYSACTAATSGFSSVNRIGQASCLCYGEVQSSCASYKTYTTAFDDAAKSCVKYMADQQYKSVAKVMQEKDFDMQAGFCARASSSAPSWTGSALPSTVPAATQCTAVAAAITGGSGNNGGGAVALMVPLFTASDRGSLMLAALFFSTMLAMVVL